MSTASNMKTQNKFVNFTKGYNFNKKKYLYLIQYKNDIIFLIRQTLVRDYYTPEIIYYFLSILMFSNEKT
jgi:hypothetical protein